MLRIALGLCTGIMHNIHKNIHKADAYFSSSERNFKEKIESIRLHDLAGKSVEELKKNRRAYQTLRQLN
jgi:adenylate cyclase class IV